MTCRAAERRSVSRCSTPSARVPLAKSPDASPDTTTYGWPMIVAIVRFPLDPPLTMAEAATAFEASAPNYQNVPGLRRKHYLLGEGGSVGGGVYLWASRADAERLYTNEWSARIASRYGAAPTVDYFDSPVTVDSSEITLNAV